MKQKLGEWAKNPRWFKAYVMHKDDSLCGHEIISPISDIPEAFCPICMERCEKERLKGDKE